MKSMLGSIEQVAESNNNEVIGFIASTVEAIRNRMDRVEERMATKEQLDVATSSIRGDIEQIHLRLDDGSSHLFQGRAFRR
ncbi:MAG TPA: hypothetical protein VGW32_02965 [Pyrinomonadaceae bacterium]|nr:hypothetical protein [Pyrinomonadaceae bacterium]